jgi:hypothetical protein
VSKEESLKLRGVAFDAGLRLARAKAGVEKAREAMNAARAEQDIAGVEFEQTTRKAAELEAASFESIAKGEPEKGLELLPIAEVAHGTESASR